MNHGSRLDTWSVRSTKVAVRPPTYTGVSTVVQGVVAQVVDELRRRLGLRRGRRDHRHDRRVTTGADLGRGHHRDSGLAGDGVDDLGHDGLVAGLDGEHEGTVGPGPEGIGHDVVGLALGRLGAAAPESVWPKRMEKSGAASVRSRARLAIR